MQHPHSRHRLAGSLLAIFIAALYTLTYNARPISTDEMRIMDGVTSFYHFGDWRLDETLFLTMPQVLSPQALYPTLDLPSDERSLSLLLTPLYAIAHALPAIGMLHTVWLFNLIVTTATVCVFYAFGLRLGYSWQIAVVGSLMLGIGTLLWPYSKTLFREPVTALLLLLAAYVALVARQSHRQQAFVAWMIAILAFAGALWLKTSAVMALPALIMWVLPGLTHRRERLLRVGVAAAMLLPWLLIGLYVFVPALQSITYDLALHFIPQRSEMFIYLAQALHSYVFSLNGSLWGASPVLILAVGGLVVLWRQKNIRLGWVVVTLVLGYVVGHGLLTIQHWYGGLSYPPRFLLPVIPFVMLLVLPVLDMAWQKRSWLLSGAIGLLAMFSSWVQCVNAASFIEVYSNLLPSASRGLLEWQPGLTSLEYARWLLLPQTWGALGYDVSWWRVPDTLWVVAVMAVMISALIALLLVARITSLRGLAIYGGVASIGLVILMGNRLVRLNREDARTASNVPALNTAFATLEAEAQNGDVLLMPFSSYMTYVFNHNRSARFRPFTLPIPRIPTLTAGQSALDLDSLEAISLMLPRVVAHFAGTQERVWFLTNTHAFQANAPRADEHYFADTLYWMKEVFTGDPTVRLVEYAPVLEPEFNSAARPDQRTDLQFGDAIRLEGVSLPRGLTLYAGDILPVQLHWITDTALPQDYTVTMFIASRDGEVVAQGGDSFPAGGFRPTTRWLPEIPTRDRRALELPDDLPAGQYELWVVVYRFVDGQPQRLPVTQGENRDGTIGVLPVLLTVISD